MNKEKELGYFYKEKEDTIYFCGVGPIDNLKLVLENAKKNGCVYFEYLSLHEEEMNGDPLNQYTPEHLYWAVRRGVGHAIWDIAAATKKLDIEDDFFNVLKENINAGLKTMEGKVEEYKEKEKRQIEQILDQIGEILTRMNSNGRDI